jgi:hypothetical protein
MPTINPIRQRVAWLVSVLAAGGFLAAAMTGATHADSERKASRVALPVIHIEKGEECVEPEEVMRRDHMNLILHQRDKTMRQGIRSEKHSLKKCINCHADSKTNSVLGKEGFCESCHSYAAVSIDCFSCHSSSPEKEAAQTSAVAGARKSLDQVVVSSPVLNHEQASAGKSQ